ncbi:MAG: sigma-54-dependent transcriptional regulator [Planctomycetota bacterium]|jgi:DNA-binding NtrC family response regulator
MGAEEEHETETDRGRIESVGRILVVDDEESMRHFLHRGLKRRGHAVRTAANADEALAALKDDPVDLILLDIMMPGKSGMDLLPEFLDLPDPPRVIMMTGFATIETAVEAMKRGAVDYITKPLSLPAVARAAGREIGAVRLARENRSLREALARKAGSSLLGTSRGMKALRREIARIAPGNSTVLLLGESGTGKEIAAQAIHEGSPRSGGPFVPVNCGAFPDTLLESELFGYFPGAFTGATKRKIGHLERARGGTLFLDEITELSPSFQVLLLRVLQEREVLPLGGTDPLKVDFRLVAASNQDPEEAMLAGRFREDLYYRVNVITLKLPPLRERPGDPTLLAHHFLREFGRDDQEFDAAVFPLLEAYRWPGNVRELINVVERSAAMASGRRITVDALPEDVRATRAPAVAPPPYAEARGDFERRYVEDLLRAANGNVSKAARLAGISRPSLHARIKELELDTAQYKKP